MFLFKKMKKVFTMLIAVILCFSMAIPSTVMAAESMSDGDEYAVTLQQSKGGTISFEDVAGDTAQYSEDDRVAIEIDSDDGYQIDGIEVSETDSGDVLEQYNEPDMVTYYFDMPDEDVEVQATFIKDEDIENDYGIVTYATALGSANLTSSSTQYEWYRDYEGITTSAQKIMDYTVSGSDTGSTIGFCGQLHHKFSSGVHTEYDLLGWTFSSSGSTSGAQERTVTQDDITMAALGMKYIEENTSYNTALKRALEQVWIWRQINNDGSGQTVGIYDGIFLTQETSGLTWAQQGDLFVEAGSYAYDQGIWYGNYNCWGRVYSDGSSQDIIQVFYEENNGWAKLVKASSNTTVTNGNSNYSLSGAVYGVYSDSGCTSKVAELTTTSDGSSNTVELSKGTYYVKEISASAGYTLDTTVYTINVTANETTTLNVKETPKTSYVTLVKSSAIPSITDGNGCYSLVGAEFTVYTDSACTTVAKTASGNNAVLTVQDEAGNTNTLEMPLGTYYVKETALPTGYYWDSSTGQNDSTMNIHTADLTTQYSSGNPYKITVSDRPMLDPLGITIYKVDGVTGEAMPEGDAALDGAQFTIKYYDGWYNKSTLPSSATRTWVIQTIKDSDGKYRAELDDDHKVSGDSFYYDGGSVALPLGTYTIQETTAPTGYRIEGEFKDQDDEVLCEAGEVFVTQYLDQFSSVWLYGGNVYTGTDIPKYGGVIVAKVDKELTDNISGYDGSYPQGNASFENATFKLYNRSENSVNVKGKDYLPGEVIMTLTTQYDSSRDEWVATTGEDVLPYGTYGIVEESGGEPKGYLNSGILDLTFSIRTDHEMVDLTAPKDAIQNNPIRGGVIIAKWDKELVDFNYSHINRPQGNGTLAGATFEILNDSEKGVLVDGDHDGKYEYYQPGEVVMTLTTEWDSSLNQYVCSTGSRDLPYGHYIIREAANGQPKGYLHTGILEREFDIVEDGVIVDMTASENSIQNNPIRGGVIIAKWDKELVDFDYDHENRPQGDGTLADATFEIVNDSTYCVLVDGDHDGKFEHYEPGEVVMTLTTKWDDSLNQYVCSTGDRDLPYGHYIIREATDGQPEGYLHTGILEREFDIEEDGVIVDMTASENSIQNNPIRGGVIIAKWDKELVDFDYDHENRPQGDGTLAGAVFEITNTSEWCVLVDSDDDGTYEHYEPGEVVKTIVTEWDEDLQQYVARTGARDLPYGSYHIEEVEPPVGYLHTGILERDFEIREDGVIVDMTASENSIQNNPIRGGFELQKRDAQTAIASPQGSASFEGIEVALVNESEWCVLVDVNGDGEISEIEHFEPGDYIMSFFTDENGYIITDERLLPYGSYRLYEVNIPMLDGYLYGSGDFIDSYPDYGTYETTHTDMLADANVVCDFKIRTDNKIVNLTGVDDEYGETEVELTPTYDPSNSIYDTSEHEDYENMVAPGYAMENLVKRGDVALRKQDGDDQSTPDGPIEWKLTSATTGETHYFWTDENGDYSSDSTWNPHTYETNLGEDYTDGIWFYGYNTDVNGNEVAEIGTSDVGYDEDHLEVVDNSLGALPYDTYYLDELPGEYNQGKTLVHTEFDIYRDMRVVDLGTIDNYSYGLETTATSAEDGRKYLDADDHVVVDDSIEYWGLNAGEEYTFVTMLYDLNTGDFVKASADDVDKPDDSEPDDTEPGIVEPDDSEPETSEDADSDISELATTFNDDAEPEIGDAEVEDIESDENNAIDEYFDNDIYNYVYEMTTITPTHKDGTETVEFKFDATGLEGHTVVIYEYMFDANGNLVVSEEEPDNEDQMLYFPLIGTELTSDGGSHLGVADGEITLVDTVMYEGLPTNRNVTMSGTLYDKETEKAIATAETTWFNEEPDGEIEIEFTFDASQLTGGAVVAAEEAYVNNTLVGHHFDWDDENQTVYFPSVGTTMTNNWTGEHQATVFENHNIDFTDVVSYTGLDTSKQYIVKGYLMDPETQEVVIDAYGLEVTSESEVFTPSEPDGEIEVHFDFFAFGLQDTYTTAFEYLYEVNDDDTGTLIAQHTDYEDADQTVQLMKPTLWTDASITGTGSNQTDATDEVSITDMLDITDLIIGHTYYVYGKAVHSDGTPVLDATTGEPVELYNMFVADATEMELDIMQFVFDATGLDGQSVVFEEYMYADADRTILITEEEDLGAYEETIFFNSNDVPVIGTTLVDDMTGTHEAAASGEISLTDTIAYEGLTIGETYTASGTLMDKATGEKLLDANGDEITATSEEFVPETPSGTVEVTFTFDATGLSGLEAVAFESLYGVEGDLIATHEDINDADQTVLLTDIAIGTTLLDEYTGTHDAFISRNGKTTVSLVDTIAYSGLTAGEEYSVSGTLMNKATGLELFDANGNAITAEATFTAEDESGYIDVTFEFDATSLAGITTVAYESLYGEDKEAPIATHEDINDEEQSVLLNGPIVGTSATESGTGNKTVAAGRVSITDTVDYASLVAGKQYTLVGYAVNPASGDAIKDANENTVTSSATFTADATAGSTDVMFAFDASNLGGQTIVFVEYLYYGDSTDEDDLIAWHFDLTDEAQSITIESPEETPTDETQQIITTSTPAEVVSTTAAPTSKKTADMRYIWIIIAVAGCAAVAIAYVARRRIRVRK